MYLKLSCMFIYIDFSSNIAYISFNNILENRIRNHK